MPEDARTEAAARRTRRRFARRQWRRRWLAWRQIAVASVVALALGLGIYALWFSSWLDLERVEVRGAQILDADQVRDRAGVADSKPLARIDLDAAEARVASLAAVRRVDVSRQWPDTVLVEIEERTPIAVVDLGGRLRGLDAEGVVFSDYRSAPAGLPRVQTEIGTTASALREAALVVSALPADLVAAVDFVEVVTVDRISLVLKGGRQVVWGSAADSSTKARVLAGLLTSVEAEVYDVSVPSNPATRP